MGRSGSRVRLSVFWALWAVCAAAFATSATVWAQRSHDAALLAAREDVSGVVVSGAKALENVFGLADVLLRRLSEATLEGDLSGPTIDRLCPSFLCSTSRRLSPYMLMAVTRADGDVLVQDTEMPRRNLAARDYFDAQRERDADLYIGAPRRTPLIDGLFVPMSRRVTLRDGSFGGIVAAAINVDLFRAVLQGLADGRVDGIRLRDARGTSLVDWSAEARSRPDASCRSEAMGITASRVLRIGDLSVEVCRSPANALRPWRNQLLAVAGAGSLLLLAPVLAYPAVSRYLRRQAGLRELVAGSSDMQFIVAARPDGRFVLEALTFSREGARGPAAASLVGRTARDLFPPETADAVEADYRAVLASGETRRIERRIRIGGAAFVWSSVLVPLHEPGGGRAYIYGAATDMTEDRRLERRLLGFVEDALRREDEERRRIARELHDTTGQNLIAAGFALGVVQRGLADAPQPVRAALAQVRAMLDASVAELRTLSYVLHPALLDEAGLEVALGTLAEGFQQRAGIAVAVAVDHEIAGLRWSPAVELALYRVAQEALTNVQRHAAAQEARVSLRKPAPGRLELVIEDGAAGSAGAAPTATPVTEGAGVRGMRDRLEALGGTLSLTRRPSGLRVTATLPARAAAGDA
ncbi:histidine kinase [Methylobacterium crusticola]|uniref:histidine kinase n=1 Tax=Methylobacterium crusticola TaxID=1697972 RepID=UPI000FFBFD0B|nr:histidine kinase [Methylobacterium crusticola]